MDDAHLAPITDFAPLHLRMHPGGHPIVLTGPDVLLGRHSEADLRMPLPDVSRRHCRFVFAGGTWQLIDLDSLNGVYLNGARVRRAALHPGDHIRICGFEFDVEVPDGLPAEVDPQDGVFRSIADALPTEEPQRRAS
jgi:pSer/pThr/pTyr-binding forkhead associated (FHA) protein